MLVNDFKSFKSIDEDKFFILANRGFIFSKGDYKKLKKNLTLKVEERIKLK